MWGGEGDNGRGERESGQVTGGGLARDPRLRVINPVATGNGVVRRGGWAREVWGGEGDNGRGAGGSAGKVWWPAPFFGDPLQAPRTINVPVTSASLTPLYSVANMQGVRAMCK